MDMKTHSDKLWDLYKERRDSGLPVSLTVSFSNGTESFYYSSNPPKPGAADRQKQRRRQRGCRGHGGRARVQKDAGAAKTAAAVPSYAAVTRAPPSLPQTCPTKRARHPSEASNVSLTVNTTAPTKVVDAPPNSNSGTQNADAAADTDKEVATSADSEAVAIPVAAISSRPNRPQTTMQQKDRTATIQKMSNNSTDKPLPPPTPSPLSPAPKLDGFYHTPTTYRSSRWGGRGTPARSPSPGWSSPTLRRMKPSRLPSSRWRSPSLRRMKPSWPPYK